MTTNQNVNSSETIYVLNDKYQYEADAASTNAKWIDTANILSVKRDKTIYAIRATNDYTFNGNTNQEFFANTAGQSNLYRNFGSNTQQSILMTNPAPVYGDIINKQVGLAGSLVNGFSYNGSGSINVDSNVNVYTTPVNVALSSHIQMNFDGSKTNNVVSYGNVDGNTCGRVLKLTTNDAKPVWNRLINAKVDQNVLVNCSTDPCDLNGAAIRLNSSDVSGTAVSNEAYREQVAVKSNPLTSNLNINNPVYIARVSPFGTNLTGTTGVVENVKLHSFTGSFFANLPADNVIYANGNLLTNLSISGSINTPSLSLFNSNVLTASSTLNGTNLQNVPSTLTNLNNIVTVSYNANATNLDTLSNSGQIVDTNGNLVNTGTFSEDDKLMVVQGNVTISPSLLMDRLSPSTTSGFVIASNVFSYSSADNRTSVTSNIQNDNQSYYSIAASIRSSVGVTESSAKYLYLTGTNIKTENWTTESNYVAPVTVPNFTGIPNQANYVTGNIIDVYVQKGSIGVSNYTPYADKANSGDWVKSIPSFMNTFSEPNGNVYLDINIFGNVASETKIINVGNLSNPVNISASLVDNYNFYFFGNTSADSRTNNRLGNVVASTSSVMANTWSYDTIGARNASCTTQWFPTIVYGDVDTSNGANVVRPMTLNNTFANVDVDYKLEFPSYVGKTTAPSSGPISFFANIGTDGLVGKANATSYSQFNLDNNAAVNDILLNDVAFTQFTIKSNSYKYTDIGTVIPQTAGVDSAFNAVLPFAGNIAAPYSSGQGSVLGDVALNVITDYFQNPSLLSGDANNVHRLTIYDIQYRYAITGVIRSGTSPLSTKFTINGSPDLATNLMSNSGDILTSTVNVNLAAPEFALFTYDSVGQYSPTDALYPFTDVNTLEKDRWFPGFNYRQDLFYSSKTDVEVDFTIDKNTYEEKTVSFLFQAVNANGNTVSVAKSTDNAFKSIPIRKIRFGSTGGVNPYYGYIVVKVLEETSSYVVILYKLNSGGNNYDSNISIALPVTVNVKSIELTSAANGSKQQVEFKSTLRVYAPDDTLVQSFNNAVNSHKSPLSLFNYSSTYGSNNSSIGVNIYAAPPSNAIMQWSYNQSVINKLVTYEYVDNVINGMSGYKSANSQASNNVLFAMSQENPFTTAQPDTYNPSLAKIPALSNRYYLDNGLTGAMYIDIADTYILSSPIEYTVGRSVEWVLKRKLSSSSVYEVVGRGLLSHTRDENSPYEPRDYLIFENDLSKISSGFQMSVNTNVTDLSARLLSQSIISTGPLKNGTLNELALNVRTIADKLSMVIYRVNPDTKVEDSQQFGGQTYSFSAGASNIDLAMLMKSNNSSYKGQLPSFSLSSIRGYQFGEVANRTNALFSVNYSRDNYAIMQLWQNTAKTVTFGGRYENDNSNVTFAQLNGTPNKLNCSLLSVVLNNVSGKGTLNKDFATLTDKVGGFFKYASYTHNGFGSMSYNIIDFTSNYNKTLPSQDITSSSLTPVFDLRSNSAYKVTTPVQTSDNVDIKYDNTANKYYAPITRFGQTTNLYFRGIGLASLPTIFNGANTVLLYTGTRPMVISTLTMKNGATINDVLSVANVGNNMFNNQSWLQYQSSNILKQTYSVFFTNGIQSSTSPQGSTNVGSITVSPSVSYFTSTGNFYLGGFINSAGILSNNFVNIDYTNGSRKYPFYIVGGEDKVNPVQTDAVVTSPAGADTKLYDTYVCYNTALGRLFDITLLKTLTNQSYSISINPATVQIYEAIDADYNGEIDVQTSNSINNSFNLDAAFSELLYTLPTPVSGTTKLKVPKVVDSWPLDGSFHNIIGSSLSVRMNVKWNIGYNLGNFFTIRENTVAEFDVITIHTEYTSSANNNNMTSLIVSPKSSLIISNKESWAHASVGSALSGLAFKLNSTKITSGEIVRLFVDNQISTNTFGLTVGGKSYKIASYDQERYATLLDEQIRFTNNIE